MTKDEFNSKYAQHLKQGCIGLDILESALIEELDAIFSQVFVHIPRFEYSHVTYKHYGFVVATNLREIAGAFGQEIQDLAEDTLDGAFRLYLELES